jgi:hypothetical protein
MNNITDEQSSIFDQLVFVRDVIIDIVGTCVVVIINISVSTVDTGGSVIVCVSICKGTGCDYMHGC